MAWLASPLALKLVAYQTDNDCLANLWQEAKSEWIPGPARE